MRPKTYSKLLSDELCISLGSLSEICGERPSTLLGWTESEDVIDRLNLDLSILNLYGIWQKEQSKKEN